jgi:hypothetical protein
VSSTEDTPQGALEGVNTEQPPSSETQAEPKTSLDVVIGVLDKAKEAPPASENGEATAKAEPETAEPPKETDPEKGELSDKEWKQLSARTQSRIRDLSRQAREAQSKLADVTPKVEAFEKLADFTRQNRLAKEEIDNALNIAALIKSDPIKAFAQIETIYKNLSSQVGAQLPEDLAQRVQQGYISEVDAKEQARLRAQNQIHAQQREAEAARSQEEQRQKEHSDRVRSVVSAADKWAQTKAKSDPDWAAKEKRITEAVELRLLKSGKFPTEQEVVAMCEDILTHVNGELKPYLAQRRAMNPVTSNSSASRQVAPEPKTSVDVIDRVLSGMAS